MPRSRPPTARPCPPTAKAFSAALGLATLALAGAQSAQATTVLGSGAILSTFSGPHTAPADGPFSVQSVSAVQDGGAVQITATMNGPATAAGYIVGVNRGAGTALLDAGPTPVGAGIDFDAVAVLIPGGGSVVELFPSMAFTPLSEVTFSGDTVTAVIPLADFPMTGFAPSAFRYSFWPRNGLVPTDNTQISEFVPPDSTFVASFVTAVPEPSAWALMLLGVGALGAALRSRRLPTASPTP